MGGAGSIIGGAGSCVGGAGSCVGGAGSCVSGAGSCVGGAGSCVGGAGSCASNFGSYENWMSRNVWLALWRDFKHVPSFPQASTARFQVRQSAVVQVKYGDIHDSTHR